MTFIAMRIEQFAKNKRISKENITITKEFYFHMNIRLKEFPNEIEQFSQYPKIKEFSIRIKPKSNRKLSKAQFVSNSQKLLPFLVIDIVRIRNELSQKLWKHSDFFLFYNRPQGAFTYDVRCFFGGYF